MITFKQYLIESENSLSEFLHKECQPFLTQAQGQGWLYRGVDQPGSIAAQFGPTTVHIKQVRKDRKALTMPYNIHKIVDDWMIDKFNIPGRTGSVFAFGESSFTTLPLYGKEYIMIPRGDFKFIWSPNVTDLYEYFEKRGWLFDNSKDLNIELEEILEDLDYQDTDLSAAIKSGCEVMIECDEYYLIEANTKNMRELNDII